MMCILCQDVSGFSCCIVAIVNTGFLLPLLSLLSFWAFVLSSSLSLMLYLCIFHHCHCGCHCVYHCHKYGASWGCAPLLLCHCIIVLCCWYAIAIVSYSSLCHCLVSMISCWSSLFSHQLCVDTVETSVTKHYQYQMWLWWMKRWERDRTCWRQGTPGRNKNKLVVADQHRLFFQCLDSCMLHDVALTISPCWLEWHYN